MNMKTSSLRGSGIAHAVYALSCIAVILVVTGSGPFFLLGLTPSVTERVWIPGGVGSAFVLGLTIEAGIICFSLFVGYSKGLALAPEVHFSLMIARRVSIVKLVLIVAVFVVHRPNLQDAETRRKIDRLVRAGDSIASYARYYLRRHGGVPQSLDEVDRDLTVDPFGDGERWLTWYPCGSYMIIRSVGPDQIEEATVPVAICDLEFRADVSSWLEAQGIRVYDPSNGTRSGGDIFITRSY